MKQIMLTTTDNPYNPFDNFDEWYAYDSQKGYHTSEYLARVCIDSNELSEEDQFLDIERAIDSILSTNVLGIYKKVVRDFKDST